MVRAVTTDHFTCFDSDSESGYSIDNLSRAPPAAFAVAYNTGSGNDLTWDEAPEADFDYFRIYRSETEGFTPGPGNLVHSTSTNGWLDTTPEGWKYHYKVTTLLDGARAIIVDVRRNSGGDDRVGKVIADRFADTRRLYMVTRDRNGPDHDDFAAPKYWHVEPAGKTFTRPTILLTSRFSVSAAENFALAMRVIPHVTVVGDTTSGCFADMRWFELDNGWRYSLSRNLFVDYTGKCWEGIGVPPDVLVQPALREGEKDAAMDRALELLAGEGPPLQDERASAAAARE